MRNLFLFAAAVVTAFALNMSPAAAQYGSCDAYARDYANRATAQPSGNIIGGTILGAGVGAVIGGVAGGGKNRVGSGAAIGAGVGALGGAAANSNRWQGYYQAAYNDCVARSAPPRPVHQAHYEPWTPAWYSYCSSRYRTFNPNTGYFHAGGGRYVFCR